MILVAFRVGRSKKASLSFSHHPFNCDRKMLLSLFLMGKLSLLAANKSEIGGSRKGPWRERKDLHQTSSSAINGTNQRAQGGRLRTAEQEKGAEEGRTLLDGFDGLRESTKKVPQSIMKGGGSILASLRKGSDTDAPKGRRAQTSA